MYKVKIDEYDKKILDLLTSNSRVKLKALSEIVGLSSPACHGRIIKLENLNFIKGYTALLNYKKLGFDILGLVFVKFEEHTQIKRKLVLEQLLKIQAITEILHLTGGFDLQLRIMVKNSTELRILLNEQISIIPGIMNIQTSIVVDVCKSLYGQIPPPTKHAMR